MSPLAFKLLQELTRQQRQDPNYPIHFANEINRFQGDHIEVSLAWEQLLVCGLVVRRWKNPEGVNGGSSQESFYITPRGHEWLKAAGSSPSPEDPEGFLAALGKDAKLDPFVRTTVEEAVWAHAHERSVSALVCLAAAVEFMIRTVDDATSKPEKAFNISAVFDSLDRRLDAAFTKKGKPPHVASFLSPFSIALRDARNKVAHRGTVAEITHIRRFLLQYLDWHEAAAQLRDNPLC